jgi:hypothetical protein
MWFTAAFLSTALLQSATPGNPGGTEGAEDWTSGQPEEHASSQPLVFKEADRWRTELNTWVWVLGIEGDIGARGVKVDASASFGDILEASDSIFAFSGRLELGCGRIGGFVDGLYSKLGVEDVQGPEGVGKVDIEFEQTVLDFGLMYRVVDCEPHGDAAGGRRDTTIDLYAGGRYNDLELTLSPSGSGDRSASRDWLDPIIGAKAVVPFAERWHIAVNGDVGGFGAASDFTWSATAVVGYDFALFNLPASVTAGYRAIGWDYQDGSGRDGFTWDVVQHGFILGLGLKF